MDAKSSQKNSHNASQPRAQRGMATILTILLVGLALSASVLGVMYNIHTTQNQLLTVHSQTQAQMRAWTGAQAVQKFLEGIYSGNKLVNLAQAIDSANGHRLPLSITNSANGNLDGIAIALVDVDSVTEPTSFTAEITGTSAEGKAAEAKSVVRVVYALSSGSGAESEGPTSDTSEETIVYKPGGMDYKKNLRLSGGINVKSDGSSSFIVTVDGDVTSTGNNIIGVDIIRSTGTISLDSGSTFKELHANCDVVITGSVKAATIKARRNVCMSRGEAAGTDSVTANGTIKSQAPYGDRTIGNGDLFAMRNAIDVDACRASGSTADGTNLYAETCSSLDEGVAVDLGFGSAGAISVKAKGDVKLATGHIGDLKAEGNLILMNWNGIVDSGFITGKVINQGGGSSNLNNTKGSNEKILTEMVSSVTSSSYVVDANIFKSLANYIFFVDTNGFRKVTVSNVSGIEDGDYFFGTVEIAYTNYPDYLCSTLTSASTKDAPRCNTQDTPSSKLKTICEGNSKTNGCFSYDAERRKWSLDGKSIAQGIAWFNGDLNIGSGTYFNTFVVSGSITTSGADKVYAPNYAGYDGKVDGVEYAPTGICVNSFFPDIYPKQFCDKPKKKYLGGAGDGIGNYALIAGSVPVGAAYSADTYVGGDITTGANTEIFGNLMAGNEFISSGATTIHGYATAQAAGKKTNNVLSGATTYDLTKQPPTFDPTGGLTVKTIIGSDKNTEGSDTEPSEPGFKIKWVTYL